MLKFCGGFLGRFEDRFTPPSSDDDSVLADAEVEKYMPKDHRKALKSVKKSRFSLGRTLKSGGRLPALGWGPHIGTMQIQVLCGTQTIMQEFQAIKLERETISPYMLDNLAADDRENRLHTLELTQCRLTSFPPIGDLRALKELRLSKNKIIVCKRETFSEGLSLERLICDYNKLEALEPRVFSKEFLPSLEVLNFAHNKLSFLPTDFASELTKLKFLDLSYNKLQTLPDSIMGCGNLQLLFLQDNELKSLPAGINRLKNLRKLFVSYNDLTQLPDSIGGCCNLEKLQVSSNRITLMPDNIINLWKRRNGCLEEFLVDGNPLVQPGLSAFEKGQIDIGFELFDEWIREQEEQRRLEREAAKQEALERAAKLAEKEKLPVPVAGPPPLPPPDEAASTAVAQSQRNSSGWFLSEDAQAEVHAAAGPVVGPLNQPAARIQALYSMQEGEEATHHYYFEHLKDPQGHEDPTGLTALRSEESKLLLMKKVKYVEGQKKLALAKKQEAKLVHEDVPKHLQKFLDPDVTDESSRGKAVTPANFKGKIPVTNFDVNFCILVSVTKHMEPTCRKLFQRYLATDAVSNEERLKREDWENLCQHVKVKFTKEVQQEMWELLAGDEDVIRLKSFVAGWHIHDVEERDPWIRRASRVLRLSYYSMDIDEVRARLKAKGAEEAETPHLGGAEDSSMDGSSSSTDENEEAEAQRVRRNVYVPLAEGERRRVQLPTSSPVRGGAGRPAGARAGWRNSAITSVGAARHGANGDGVRGPGPLKDLGSLAPVSQTEEQHMQRSFIRDDDSGQDSADSDSSFPSEELSISSVSSASSFDGKDKLRELEQEEEAADEYIEQQRGRKMEIKSDADIRRLMEMPREEILRQPPKPSRAKEEAGRAEGPTRKVRQFPAKLDAKKETHFRTDVYTVRLAIREARRNMTPENFITVVNFLLRGLKLIEHTSHPSQSYWHVDDPNFRHTTGVETINPYVRQLLEQMGFVCLQERYWVWPSKHLNIHGKEGRGGWGDQMVPPTCLGKDNQRLGDMVEIFTRTQKTLLKSRHSQRA